LFCGKIVFKERVASGGDIYKYAQKRYKPFLAVLFTPGNQALPISWISAGTSSL
jgi:hypothetical protein